MTPARIAAATARTQTRSSEPSSMPPPNHRPSMRHIWLGTTPATNSTASACQSPMSCAKLMRAPPATNAPHRRRRPPRPPPRPAIGEGGRHEAADEDVEAGIHLRGQWIEQTPHRERDDGGDL